MGVGAGLIAEMGQDRPVQQNNVSTRLNLSLKYFPNLLHKLKPNKIPLRLRQISLQFLLITENILRESNRVKFLNPIKKSTEELYFLDAEQQVLLLEFTQVLGED